MESCAQLVGRQLPVGPAPARDHDAGGGHAGEARQAPISFHGTRTAA